MVAREIELKFIFGTDAEIASKEWNTLYKYVEELGGDFQSNRYVTEVYENSSYRKIIREEGENPEEQIKEKIDEKSFVDLYRFNITVSEEREVDVIPEELDLTSKRTRKIYRRSFKFKDYQYDFSEVSYEGGKKYELEIEWIKQEKIDDELIFNALEDLGKQLYAVLLKTQILFNEREKNNVFYKVNQLLPGSITSSYSLISLRDFADKPTDLHFTDLSTQPGKFFSEPCHVTHKVDGVRKQILCVDNYVFLIDSNSMNLISKNGPNIIFFIDGELYRNFKKDEKFIYDTKHEFDYYPFDVYIGKNVDINSKHSEKLNFIKLIVGLQINNIKLKEKTSMFIKQDIIFDVMNAIFDDRQHLPYKNDGLVFTPEDTKPNYSLIATKNVRKWKDEYTIDFRLIKDPLKKQKDQFFLGVVKGEKIVEYGKYYIKGKGKKEGQIWEFKFNTTTERFYPIRDRSNDKDYPNSLYVADTLMGLIKNPIREEMLRGRSVESKKGSGIENLQNYHREHKKELIKKCLSYVKDLKEFSYNPHTRNSKDEYKEEYTIFAEKEDKEELINNCLSFIDDLKEGRVIDPEKEELIRKYLSYVEDLKEGKIEREELISKCSGHIKDAKKGRYSSFSYLPSYHQNILRDRILIMLEFIGERNEEFFLIGLDDIEKDSLNNILERCKNKSRISKLSSKTNIPLEAPFNLISFAETPKQQEIYDECVRKKKFIKNFISLVKISNLKHEHFMQLRGNIIYPIYDNDVLYIQYKDDMIGQVKNVYQTKVFKEYIGYYVTKLKRQKFDVKHDYYDDCYSCNRESDILENDTTGACRAFIDLMCESQIFQDLPSISNSLLDIGIGKRDRTKNLENKPFVLGLEPNRNNYDELVIGNSGSNRNLRLTPVNIGLSSDEDIYEIVSRLGLMKAGVVTMFDSLTFFHGPMIDLVPKLLENVLVVGGIFSFIVLDAKRLKMDSDNSKSNITKFMLRHINKGKILISLGSESIVQEQTEFFFDTNSFIEKLETIGFELLESYALDKEHFLTKDEFLYSSCTSVVIMKRVRTREEMVQEIKLVEQIEF